MGSYTSFYFKAGEGEQISTAVRSGTDSRSAIVGRVLDGADRPVPDALVLLFETSEATEELLLVAHTFTDDAGHFAFGPLSANLLYLIKIYKDSLKLRELELTPEPFE